MKQYQGIRLDLGCGDNKQPLFVGMDKRKLDGVDIVHDVQDTPYPLKDESCLCVLMSHLWEHIEPKHRVDVINEVWRIMKPNGELMITSPYALSPGAFQDPTHYTCPNEATFFYFTPKHALYTIYTPKPWKMLTNDWHNTGNIQVVLQKIGGNSEDKKTRK